VFNITSEMVYISGLTIANGNAGLAALKCVEERPSRDSLFPVSAPYLTKRAY